MSKSVTLNFTDTAGGTAPTLTGAAKNYGVDFSVQTAVAGKTDIANLTSPVDALNKERFSYTSVKDAYKGTQVNEAYQSPNKGGFSVLSQCNVVATILESTDATYRVDVPISAHVVIKGLNDSNITVAHLTAILMRAVGGLYATDGSSRVAAVIRGSLTPADM